MTRRISSTSKRRSTDASVGGGAFEWCIIEERPGLLVARVHGLRSNDLCAESGGHRWQRVPPNEKRGRRQSSTVTVAVLEPPAHSALVLHEKDLQISIARGSGKGGQHRNKRDTAVTIRHIPTGIDAHSEGERSQHQNRANALEVLRARIAAVRHSAAESRQASERRQQIGSGMRGDKRRTIRTQDGTVHDHITERRVGLDLYLEGHLERLW